MAIRKVNQAICDRCGTVISSDDEDAGQLSLDQMTDEWELSGSSITLVDLCGSCVRVLRAWYRAGGAKPGPSHGQGP